MFYTKRFRSKWQERRSILGRNGKRSVWFARVVALCSCPILIEIGRDGSFQTTFKSPRLVQDSAAKIVATQTQTRRNYADMPLIFASPSEVRFVFNLECCRFSQNVLRPCRPQVLFLRQKMKRWRQIIIDYLWPDHWKWLQNWSGLLVLPVVADSSCSFDFELKNSPFWPTKWGLWKNEDVPQPRFCTNANNRSEWFSKSVIQGFDHVT